MGNTTRPRTGQFGPLRPAIRRGHFVQVLSDAEIAFAQQAAHDEMLEFGYGLDEVPMGSIERARYTFTTLPLERVRGGIWTTVEARRIRQGRPVPAHRLVDRDAS